MKIRIQYVVLIDGKPELLDHVIELSAKQVLEGLCLSCQNPNNEDVKAVLQRIPEMTEDEAVKALGPLGTTNEDHVIDFSAFQNFKVLP